jgi:uridine kinase
MTWAPAKKDVLDELAAEILHNYGAGRAVVAVDGVDAGRTTAFADDLADAMRDAGRTVERATSGSTTTVESELVQPFKANRDGGDLLLLVDGVDLHDPSVAGLWNFLVWLASDRLHQQIASALVDVSDPEHPRRIFADSC